MTKRKAEELIKLGNFNEYSEDYLEGFIDGAKSFKPKYKSINKYVSQNSEQRGYENNDVNEFVDDFSWILHDEEIKNSRIEIKITITEEENYYTLLNAIRCGQKRRGYISEAIRYFNSVVTDEIKPICLTEKQKRANIIKLNDFKGKISANAINKHNQEEQEKIYQKGLL